MIKKEWKLIDADLSQNYLRFICYWEHGEKEKKIFQVSRSDVLSFLSQRYPQIKAKENREEKVHNSPKH